VAYGFRYYRILHRDKRHRLRRCLPRRLHPPEKNTTYDDARPGFDEVPQLYIDPVECIDCGACVPVCPVSAIFALDDLPEEWKHYTELNTSYVQRQVHTRRVRQAQRSEVGAACLYSYRGAAGGAWR
jgi:NAD-dependent dihydropyrimidine dehydrogenase PreA subunit